MKKILFVLAVLALFLISACSNQGKGIVGEGSPVPASNSPPPPEAVEQEQEVSAPEQNTVGSQQEAAPETSQPEAPLEDVKEFKITAKQFSFEPETIEVDKGDKVRLIVTSVDVPHGIAIREYGINERLDPGKPVTIEFTADKEGTFTAFCSVFCGSGHSNMKGQLIVR